MQKPPLSASQGWFVFIRKCRVFSDFPVPESSIVGTFDDSNKKIAAKIGW